MVITGPWRKYWVEYFDDSETYIVYTWGRVIVEKIPYSTNALNDIKRNYSI